MDRFRDEKSLSFLILLLAALVFLPVLRFPFVWDDLKVVRDNPFLGSPAFLPLYFQPHYWRYRVPISENDYRPVQMIALSALAALGDRSPLPFRVASVFLHLFVSWLLFRLVRARGIAPTPALIFLALFALHPVHVEAVASARNLSEFLCALFLILSFRLFTGRTGAGRKAAALAFFVLAVFSKESAVIYPLLLAAFPSGRSPKTSVRRKIADLIPFFLVSGAVLALKVVLGPGSTERREISPLGAVFALSKLTLVYLGLLLRPLRLHVIYPFVKGICWTHPEWLLSLLVVVSLLLLAARLWKNSPRAGWIALSFFVSLLPALSVVGQIGRVVAEQRLYFPSIFACLLAALAAGTLLDRSPNGWKKAGAGALAVLAVLYALSVGRYLPFWKSDFSLWKRVTEICPAAAIGHNNLAIVYLRLGDSERGTAELKNALAINPDHSEAHLNLGIQYRRDGRGEEAVREFERSLSSYPSYDLAAINLSEILLHRGRIERAEKTIRGALDFNPYLPELRNCLAVVLERRGEIAEAEKEYLRAAELDPEYGAPLRNLAEMYLEGGKRAKAMETVRRAIERDPANPAGLQVLSRIHIAGGDLRRARLVLEDALRLDPANVALRSQLMALKSAGATTR
jgi:Tfp pilus assembly protein PilF